MKPQVCFIILLIFSFTGIAQKTLLVEKMGKPSKYYYHIGDKIKIYKFGSKKAMKGSITAIMDSAITITSITSENISLKEVQYVVKQFEFPRKLSIKLGEFGGVILLVMVVNNLLNNSQVFTPYVFIVSGSFLGGSLVSLMLSERRCKIGDRWKVKILDGNLR